jgi:hypothetical protein
MGQKTFTQFRVDNIVTTLPTTLEYGKEVYYKDASGNLTLWVGHEDGTAWPAVGYKEYRAELNQSGTNAPTATIGVNTIGTVTYGYTSEGVYTINGTFPLGKTEASLSFPYQDDGGDIFSRTVFQAIADVLSIQTLLGGSQSNDALKIGAVLQFVAIRVYP